MDRTLEMQIDRFFSNFRKPKSISLSSSDIDELCSTTIFQKHEIFRLYDRFSAICNSEIKTIEKFAFLQQPEIVSNQIMPLAYDFQFELQCLESPTSTEDGLNFKNFVKLLGVFSQKTSLADKSSCNSILSSIYYIFTMQH
jgi:hypothetical protein